MKKNCPNCGTDNPANFRYCTNCGHELPKTEAAEETVATGTIPRKGTAPTGISDRTNFIPPPINGGKRKSRKLWIILSCIGLFLMLVVIAGGLAIKKIMNSDKVMEVLAKQVNAKAPMMVDNVTRFDSAVVLPGNRFQYNCTLISVEKGQLDSIKAKELLEPGMENTIKTSDAVDLQYFRNHKTTVSYVYRDKVGQYMFTILITPDKYQ